MNKQIVFTLKFSYSFLKNGKRRYCYTVHGSAEALAAFKAAEGEYYSENEAGEAQYYTKWYVGEECPGLITKAGKASANTEAFDKAASLCERYDGALGNAMASVLVANLFGGKPRKAPQQVAQPEPEPEDQEG